MSSNLFERDIKYKMPNKSKKTKSAGRFGARYGKRAKDKLVKVEVKQRIKQKCPFCEKLGAKRLSKGIWECSKCDKKFAGGAFYLEEKL
jgi:large subunit ribosomal protein L37Ae